MNEEYLSFYNYLKSNNFENILNNLKSKYKNKKIILFGRDVFIKVVLEEFKITDYLDIVGMSNFDLCNKNDISDNQNISIYTPLELRCTDFDMVLNINEPIKKVKSYLKQNHYVKKSVLIKNLVQIPFVSKLREFIAKQKYTFLYIKESKNFLKGLKYDFICASEEIESKVNYLKKIKKLRNEDKKLKVVFVCSTLENKEIISLYNLVKNDKNFNVYPLIVAPDTYLETEYVDEELMDEKVNLFKNLCKTDVINGWDKTVNDLVCLHAFKPDIIFYQNPIHIKDKFSPHLMSKNALTFTIQYELTDENRKVIGSGYYKKQVSNLFKVFVQTSFQKDEYEKCANLCGKDITFNTHNRLNIRILECLSNIKKH